MADTPFLTCDSHVFQKLDSICDTIKAVGNKPRKELCYFYLVHGGSFRMDLRQINPCGVVIEAGPDTVECHSSAD